MKRIAAATLLASGLFAMPLAPAADAAVPAPKAVQAVSATRLVPDTTHLVVPKGQTPVLTGLAQRYTGTGTLAPRAAGRRTRACRRPRSRPLRAR